MEVAGFVGVVGGRFDPRAAPFDIGEYSGPPPRRLRRGAGEVIYVPRRADDAVAPETGDIALVWGRAFCDDDSRLRTGGNGSDLDAAHLDGKFALARLGDAGVELHTDRIGAGICFHCERNGTVYFGTHLGALLAVLPWRPKLNDLGIAEMIFFRAQLSDETHFAGIHRLPAGRFLSVTWPGEERLVRAHLQPAFEASGLIGRPVPDYTAETVNAMMDLGVRREGFGPRDALLLSAGRDSLLLALAEGAPPRAVVYGQPYTIDRIGGERRARQLGMSLVPFASRDWNLTTYLPLVTRLFGGAVGLNVANAVIGAHGLAEPPPVLASGNFGGSTLLGERHFNPEPMTGPKAARFQLKNFLDPIGSEIFVAEKAHILDTLTREFDELARHASPQVSARLINMRRIEARRFGIAKDLLDWFVPLAQPYVNRGFLTLVTNTPPEPMADRRISNAAIAKRLARHPVPLRYRLVTTHRLARWRARRSDARVVGQVYWPDILRRRPIAPAELLCGHDRLDEYLQRSWEQRKARRGAQPPRYLFVAGIAATVREFGL
jgi:hypothetical protein